MNILVTGGASGLGEAITIKLAEDAKNFIYFTYFKSKEQAARLEQTYKNVKALYCDFTDSKSLEALLSTMQAIELHVLVNNALPFLETTHFHKIRSTDFLASFELNILPVMKIFQKAIEIFRKVKFGKVITILSSGILNKPTIGWSKYIAEKNYLLSISKSVAVENAVFNVTSNCISPAFMLTKLNGEIDERLIEDMLAKHPLKKLLSVSETAETVVFLVNASQQINGINIVINAASDLI